MKAVRKEHAGAALPATEYRLPVSSSAQHAIAAPPSQRILASPLRLLSAGTSPRRDGTPARVITKAPSATLQGRLFFITFIDLYDVI